MAKRIYSYIRVSTPKQSLERQRRNINAYLKGESSIQFEDQYTGTSMNRPEFDRLVKAVDRDIAKGDNVIIIFDSVSRMSRNAAEGVEQYFEWYNKGVALIFLNERYIDTEVFKAAMQKQIASVSETGDKPTDKLINSIITALEDYQSDLAIRQIELAFSQSQKEVDDLRVRTSQGMTAKGAGAKISKARQGQTFTTIKGYELRIAILKELKMFGGVLNHSQFAKQHDISRMTLYRYLDEIQKDMECSSYTPEQQIKYYRSQIRDKQN